MIEIINLCKSFNTHGVLDHLNLTIHDGETIVVIGRSGCGKSVLLKHIIGIMKPEEGQVVIDETDITKLTGKELYQFRRRFGMLFQGAALFDSLTVGENVSFALHETDSGLAEYQIQERVREALALVGLEGVEQMMPADLSGGMRKRVGLARALCHRPQIMLYDEPTTGVDPIMADAINDLIVDLKQRLRITSIAVTHDMTSAYKIADRLAMLYQGRILETGTPETIRNTANPIVRQFITGAAAGPITDAEHRFHIARSAESHSTE